MAIKFEKIERNNGGEPDYHFYCIGCKMHHGVWTTPSSFNGAVWTFNGDVKNPTINPSIRVRHGQNQVCHSFITEGKIQYLSDCTHEYAGITIELPEIE